MYAEPTVADDSKLKDSAVDADALKDPSDLTGTSGIYKITASYVNHVPLLLLCVFQVVGSDYYCSQRP